MREHIKWIDVVKCFGIFLIFLGHFPTEIGRTHGFIFSHHVALFFLISGFTEAITDEKRFFVSLKKTVLGIFLPWLFFSVLSIICFTIDKNPTTLEIKYYLVQMAKGTIRNTFLAGSLWFFTCLGIVRILFSLIKKIRIKPLIVIACFILFCISQYIFKTQAPSWLYNFDSAFYYIIFYAIGYILFPFVDKVLKPNTVCGKISLMFSFVISVLYSGLVFFGKNILSFMLSIPFISLLHPIINTILIVWMYFVLAKLCENIKIFNKIGQNTLYLCGNEYIIKTLFPALLGVFGAKIDFISPFTAYIYCIILILIVTFYFSPVQKIMLERIKLLPQLFKKLLIKNKK